MRGVPYLTCLTTRRYGIGIIPSLGYELERGQESAITRTGKGNWQEGPNTGGRILRGSGCGRRSSGRSSILEVNVQFVASRIGGPCNSTTNMGTARTTEGL